MGTFVDGQFVPDTDKDKAQAEENPEIKKKGPIRSFYNRVAMKLNEFMDRRFDKKRGVETCDLVFISDLKEDPVDFSGFLIDELYGGLPIALFKPIHRPADVLSKETSTYIDIGAGKARLVIQAAEHGYKNILGVEYVPSLAKIGRDNCEIALADMPAVNWANDALDGTTMKYPDTDLVIMANNPFDRPMFDDWLKNLLDDLKANPREMVLIYNHSICSHVLEATPELERIKYSWFDRLCIYLLNPHPYCAWRYKPKGE